MISAWWLAQWVGMWSSASAAPVLGNLGTADPFSRCIAAAQAEVDSPLPAQSAPLAPSDRIALVIGVPCHRSELIPSLQYSTRDATEMGRVFLDAGFTVVPLLSSVDRRTLLQTLDDIERALHPEGTLVVYFSGHGTLREEAGELRRYLVMSDTDLGTVYTTGLSVRTLEERIDRIAAGSRVIIQDTCYAERPTGPVSSRDKGMLPPEARLELQPGDLRLYGSQYFEQAVESVDLRGSVYTVHLLRAMDERAADLDGDGCVGLLEAHRWARERVVFERAGNQIPQHLLRPRTQRASNPGNNTFNNLVVACTPDGSRRAVLDTPAEGWSLSVRDAGGAPVVGESLPPGRYRFTVSELTATATGELSRQERFDGNMRVSAGQWIDLGREIEQRRPLQWASATLRGAKTDALPAAGLGIEAGVALADRGRGRLVFGLAALYRPGPGGTLTEMPQLTRGTTTITYQPIAYRAFELEGSFQPARTVLLRGIAPLRESGALLMGPSLTMGAVIRDAYSPARYRQGGSEDYSPPLAGSYGGIGLRATYDHDPFIVSLDAGIRALLLDRGEEIPVVFLPTLSLGVGHRL